MDFVNACEQAYKNGFESGQNHPKEARWELFNYSGVMLYRCSNCKTHNSMAYPGYPKFCQECGRKMI